MTKILCFKQTRRVHDSGYRYIQYGYITEVNGKETIEIVGEYDILQTPYYDSLPANIDLTKSGWFRILPRTYIELEWEHGGRIRIVSVKKADS